MKNVFYSLIFLCGIMSGIKGAEPVIVFGPIHPLCDAVEAGDINAVRRELQDHPEMLLKAGYGGKTPLQLAKHLQLTAIDRLLQVHIRGHIEAG